MDKAEIEQGPGRTFGRWVPVFLLIAGAAAFFAFGLNRYFTFHALAHHREWLLAEVARLGSLAPIAYLAVYVGITALSVPGAAVLTIVGGFLFGTLVGTALSVTGATIGATLVFLIARSSIGEVLRRRAGPFLVRLEKGFRENAVSYLLILRLVPLFPFWLVNLVPAILGMRLRTYIVCSFFGMLPGSLVYTSLGGSLGEILDQGKQPGLTVFLAPNVLLPLAALVLLALTPIAYKRWKRAA
jgi:uncharacterized membrane protein YdjX (TVP38/TMEM64 family)